MRRYGVALILVALLVGVAEDQLLARGVLAEAVRARIVREASELLGRPVTVTQVSGDPVRGVVLEGVHIPGPGGLNPGTFFSAPRIVARYRPLALVRDLLTGRGVTASLIGVEVDRPFLVVRRDPQGRWNYADLFRPEASVVPAFTGKVDVREATAVFSDEFSLPGTSFTAHFERVTGTLDFAHSPLVHLRADAINTDGQTPAVVQVSGTAALGDETFDLDLTTHGAAAAHWSPYLVQLPWLIWQRGTVDGTLHLLASKWKSGITFDYHGQLRVRDGRALLLPQKTLLGEMNGPLTVDPSGISSDGLTMTVGTSPIFVRGEIRYASGVLLDLVVRSPSLELTTLQALLFPVARVRLAGRVRGDARIVGPPEALVVEGTILNGAGTIDQQPFANLSSGFEFSGGVLAFYDLVASAGGGRVRGTLRLDFEQGGFFVLADAADLDAGVLPTLGVTIDPTLQGRLTGFVAAAGGPDGVLAQGHAQVGAGSVQGIGFDAMDTLFWYERGGIEVDRFQASAGRSRLHAAGAIAQSGRLVLDLVATDVNLQTVGRRFGFADWLSGTADVTGSLTGSLASPVLAGTMEARHGTIGPMPFSQARGTVQVTPTHLTATDVIVRDGPAQFHVAGEVRWERGGRLDLTVQAEDVPAQRLVQIANVPLQVSGAVQGTVRLFGDVSNLQAAGSITLRNGSLEGQQVDRAHTDFRLTSAELLLDRAVAEVDGSTVEAHGSIGRTGALAISFAAQGFDLRSLTVLHSDFLRATGTVDLDGTMGGTLASPTISTTFGSTSLALNGQPFETASGTAGYGNGRLTLTPLVLRQGAGTFQLRGSVEFRRDPVVDLQARVQNAELTTLLGLARVARPFALRGSIDGMFTAAGQLSNPTATLNFSLANGALGDHPIREGVVRADLANHAITLQTLTLMPERGELVGAGRIDLRGDSDVEFSGRGLALDILRPLLSIARPLEGDLDFTVQASGAIANPLVGISVTVTKGGVGGTTFDRFVAQAYYQDGLLHVEEGLLQEGHHKVKAEGTVPFNPARLRFDDARPMDLRLFLADADLSILGLFTDQVERAEGPLEGEVVLTGSVARPRMAGSLKVTNGMIKIRNLDPALTGVQGQLTFDEDEVRLGQLTARVGDGTMTAAGAVGIREFRPDRLALQLVAQGARFTYVPLLSGVVDADLHLEGTAETPRVTGMVTLSNGDLIVPNPRPAPAARESAGGGNVVLDVDLHAGDGLWVSIGGLRLQVHGTVHAAGTQRQMRLSGAVEASRGTFTAFNNTFTLQEGMATFAEFRGTTPFLNARAQTHIGTATVFLQIQGTPDNLDLLLSSEPPLERRQIVALLAGQAGLAQVRGDQEGALRLELRQVLFGSVGQAVARALGLQEFTIQYETTQPFQLRVGKLLVTNLYLAFTSELGDLPRYIWSLEYRLTSATMLTFSVDNHSQSSVLYQVTYRF